MSSERVASPRMSSKNQYEDAKMKDNQVVRVGRAPKRRKTLLKLEMNSNNRNYKSINWMGQDSSSFATRRMFFLAIVLLYNCLNSSFEVSDALRISSIEVPAAAMNSTQLTLVCNYELEANDQLVSVTWYKNYVEFYRYKPSVQVGGSSGELNQAPAGSGANQNNNWTDESASQPDNLALANSKNYFELKGINLDMDRSNGTHVFLTHTNLASEGTYKCEVIVDPSLTTVTAERQMKIYVLPKQKLSIIDHSIQVNANESQEQTHKVGQFAYNLNDIINVTCVSSASRPAAQLSWQLADWSVPSSSKSLTRQQISHGPDLTETRLTLSFRLQPTHLNLARGQRFNAIRLKCSAKLIVEYSAESKIWISGGKTSIRKRQRHQLLNQLPSPSSLQSNLSSSTGQRSSADSQTPNRWPQLPRPRGNRHREPPSDQVEPLDSGSSGDTDIAGSSRTDLGRSASPLGLRPNGGQSPTVVWTKRQLQARAEVIDSILRQSMPNELEAPLIEAQVKVSSIDDGVDTSDIVDDDQRSDGDATTRVRERPVRDYGLGDEIEYVCSPQLALSPPGVDSKTTRSEWLLNDLAVSINRINSFDGSKFSYETQKPISKPNDRSYGGQRRPQESSQLSTTNQPTTTRLSPPPLSLEEEMSLVLASNSSSAQPNQLVASADANSSLTIELSSSLFQIKELNLKCRTIVEQQLTEYEAQILMPISASGHQQSSQFIVAHQSATNHEDRRHKSAWNQRVSGSRTNGAQNGRNNNHHQQRNKNNVSKWQQSSSSSRLGFTNFRPLEEKLNFALTLCSSILLCLVAL